MGTGGQACRAPAAPSVQVHGWVHRCERRWPRFPPATTPPGTSGLCRGGCSRFCGGQGALSLTRRDLESNPTPQSSELKCREGRRVPAQVGGQSGAKQLGSAMSLPPTALPGRAPEAQ